MRRLLDALFQGAAVLAALCMIGLLAMVLLAIVSRQLGFHVRGTDAYAGYLMAAAGFLALAHTFKKGEHIRVTLLINHLHGRPRRVLELWSLAMASLLGVLLAWYSCRLAWQSYDFNDISTGNDATPLWLPQLGMAVGTVVFALALLDELQLSWRGRTTALPADPESLRNE